MDRRQDAHGLALRGDALMQVADRLLHFGVARVADMTQCRGQVRRADEHAIHPFDRRDLINGIDARPAFDLQQHADVVVDGLQIVGDRAITRVAATASRASASDSMNGISRL
ncbi:hypothetical protein G6F32_016240 [Rhizopus arrhizus]|nr:hypothetical protein G6F32_016240 [Rhizopus arrhizus]